MYANINFIALYKYANCNYSNSKKLFSYNFYLGFIYLLYLCRVYLVAVNVPLM